MITMFTLQYKIKPSPINTMKEYTARKVKEAIVNFPVIYTYSCCLILACDTYTVVLSHIQCLVELAEISTGP